MKKLIPDDFKIPEVLETEKFRLRELTVNDLEKDYDAVKTSTKHLQHIFKENDAWPAHDITREMDLEDLKYHQDEFEKRSSFVYTVMTPDETQCLGCVYIFPSRKKSFDADVFCWVRTSELDKGLDPILFQTVKNWLKSSWPMKKIAYPGREISWNDWKNIK